MIKKMFALTIVCILVFSSSHTLTLKTKANPTTIHVPQDYPTIRQAVSAAIPGDTIFVHSGIYNEDIDIDKNNVSLIGESAYTTVVGAKLCGVNFVGVENVTVSGFTIKGGATGINVQNGHNNIISNNVVVNNTEGIWISRSDKNTVLSNIVTGSRDAVTVFYSNWNVIKNNSITSSLRGLSLSGSPSLSMRPYENEVSGNNISFNYQYGFTLEGNKTIVTANTIANNGLSIPDYSGSGMRIAGVDNTIFHNNIINNGKQVTITQQGLKNAWDNGLEGNYWTDYAGADSNGDGIGDTKYVIDNYNVDNYPLMDPWSGTTTPTYVLHVRSNPVTGVSISYAGDYAGIVTTDFEIGSKASAFTVTLSAPLAHQNYKFSYWQLDGINMEQSTSLEVKIDDTHRIRTAIATYSENEGDFSISVSPVSRKILPGESTTYDITVTPLNKISSPVSLTGSISPTTDKLLLEFNPSVLENFEDNQLGSRLTLSTTSTSALGHYTITISATSGMETESVTVDMQISHIEDFVRIVGITVTQYKSEFQSENAYAWVYLAHEGSNSHEITLLASTNAKGWDVLPSSAVVELAPPRASEPFSDNLIAFLLNFTDQADSGRFTVSAKGAPIEKTIDIDIFASWIKSSLTSVVKGFSYVDLPILYSLLVPIHPQEVKEFAQDVLAAQGAEEKSSDEVKAQALFNFVQNHKTQSERTIIVPRIDDIVKEIKATGGVSSIHKVKGECKTFSVFYGGLAMAIGLKVRVVGGLLEMSRPASGWELAKLAGHVWIEVKLNDKWTFVDPDSGYFSDSINGIKDKLPLNLNHIYNSFDPKKTYELDPMWGGVLFALAFEGGLSFTDITGEYKYPSSEMPVPKTLVLFTQSPVDLYLYNEKGELMEKGQPYGLRWFQSNEPDGIDYDRDGQFIVLNVTKQLGCKVKLVGTNKGDYSFYAVCFNSTDFSVRSVNGTVLPEQEFLFQLTYSSETGLTINPLGGQGSISSIYVIGGALAGIASATVLIVLRRKRLFKNEKQKYS